RAVADEMMELLAEFDGFPDLRVVEHHHDCYVRWGSEAEDIADETEYEVWARQGRHYGYSAAAIESGYRRSLQSEIERLDYAVARLTYEVQDPQESHAAVVRENRELKRRWSQR